MRVEIDATVGKKKRLKKSASRWKAFELGREKGMSEEGKGEDFRGMRNAVKKVRENGSNRPLGGSVVVGWEPI